MCVEIFVGSFSVSYYGHCEMGFQGSEGKLAEEDGVLIGCEIAYIWFGLGSMRSCVREMVIMTEILLLIARWVMHLSNLPPILHVRTSLVPTSTFSGDFLHYLSANRCEWVWSNA